MSAAAIALLEVCDLSVSYGKRRVVADVSFTLAAGEMLALVGESGSGKSTTALALMRLLEPAAAISGSVRLAGEDVLTVSERRFAPLRGAAMGMVFQDPAGALNPLMTIGDQIGESLILHQRLSRRVARARAVELLDLVHVPEPARRVDSYPHELSGGLKQRAMIAIAIACGPRLLIADEPTTALDASVRGAVLALLDQLRRELDLGILLISHDLGMVAEWADRVAVMYAGRIVEEAPAAVLFGQALHPYARGLMQASPLFSAHRHYSEGRLEEIPGLPAQTAAEAGCAFAPRCAFERNACHGAVPRLAENPRAPGHRSACPVTLAREVAHAASAA